MATINKQLKDIYNNVLHPETSSDQVLMPDGRNLTDSIGDSSSQWSVATGKRLAALRDVQWSPVATMPRANDGSDYFVSGTTYKGIPYSSTREVDKYLGYNVSLYSFLTALHSPYSMLYTENLNANKSKSAWGKTYHADQCGPYMGMQCTSFVEYVVGLKPYWLSHEYDYAEKMGYIIRKGRATAAKVSLYDILLRPGHDKIISAITYNQDGAIASIEVSESVPPIPQITTYTPASFDAEYDNDNYVLYRVANNPDISLEYDEVGNITYNDDICTILGDRACFREGDTIAVSYTMGSYTSMQIYKDGTLLSTKQLSSGSHYVDLTNDNLAPGFYKARLTDGTAYSDYTYFEVVEADVACSIVDGKCVVAFGSGNGSAVYVDFCALSGDVIARWKLTGIELLKGEAVIDVAELASWQPRYSLTGAYCKVLFQGEYGMVPSAMVASGL